MNFHGGFYCVCKDGYEGDGYNCSSRACVQFLCITHLQLHLDVYTAPVYMHIVSFVVLVACLFVVWLFLG